MTQLLWNEFRTHFPRDEHKFDTVRYYAFCIDNTVIWNDCFVTPYNNFFAEGPHTFESVMVDLDGEQVEAVHMSNGKEEYTVICPEMITAMFLSDPQIIERWEDVSKDGFLPAPGWKFDPNKPDFPRFYTDGEEPDGSKVRVWGNGTKETL